ncbi:MAG TPA: c-type cytochrome biogenesis protein CcsB [Actinomycetota bacterium]|nr:c-type cytochrome biogenesis protein CcsB [Actinomycetota bacterium]
MTPLELNDTSNALFNVALFAYVGAMVASFAFVAFRARALAWASTVVGAAGLAANLGAVITRGLAAERFPWGNMYEYSMAMTLVVVAAYLVGVELTYRIRTVGGPVYAFVVFTLAIASLFFYVPAGPLLPALNSYWRQIHVTSMITSSSLLGIGCVLTILYLLRDRSERRGVARLQAHEPPPIMGAAVDTELPPDYVPGDDDAPAPSPRRIGLPSAATLDRLAYRFISFGFPIWTFGVIGGAIWAQEAWGRYWGWDPKETWSFITWVVFAGYLHARATSGWKGRRAATIALVGFVSLLVTYYAVNLWIAGLHSYAT